MTPTISLELDDFGPFNHRFDLLEKLRVRYPDFKITMFTVCWDIRYKTKEGGTPISKPEYQPFVDMVKRGVRQGWLEIAVHGLTHAPYEFLDLEPRLATAKVKFAQEFLESTEIPYVKLFKAPYWQIRDDSKEAIQEMGFEVVEDDYYNWNIKDEFPVELDEIIAHGHVQDEMGNGLDESMIRLMQIPEEYEWKFVSEAIL